MCNCLEKTKQQVDTKMKERVSMFKNAIITEEAQVQETAFIIGKKGKFTYSIVSGKYMQGKRTTVFREHVLHTYCPFCGEKL